jgi:hypothetical protein
MAEKARHSSVPKHRSRRIRWPRLIASVVALMFVLVVTSLGWGVYSAGSAARAIKADWHGHQYMKLAQAAQALGQALGVIQTTGAFFSWLRLVPGVSGSYADIMDLLSAGAEDLTAVGTVFPPVLAALHAPGTPAQRAARVKLAVSQAGLAMARRAPQIVSANAAIQRMNSAGLPGILVQHGLDVTALKQASRLFVQFLPAMTGPHPVLATLLGIPTPERYLVIFQNSGELRATGGFFTAYGYVPVADGKIGHITAQNIQTLESRVTYRPSPPTIVGLYLPVTYWHIRDANTALPGPGMGVPDVPEAAANISRFYRSIAGAPPVNGMVFIDTWFADRLIADVGGVNVPVRPGKAVHVTAKNANLTMELMAENRGLPSNRRKLFLATMMKELLHDMMHGSGATLLKVLGTVAQSLQDEQLMLFFNNPAAQRFVAQRGWGGIIPAHVNGDFVEVIDENLLGHKDNYWMRESYDVNIRTIQGRNQETVTIHWVEPALSVPVPPYLVVPYRAWVTIFAPAGSQLVSETASASGGDGAGGGIDSDVQDTTDPVLNKTEFGAHISWPARTSQTQPPAQGTLVSTFWLPPDINIHRVLVQKQPGIRTEDVTVSVNGVTRHIVLDNARTWLHFAPPSGPRAPGR